VNFEQILEVYMIAENTTFDPAIIIDLHYFFEAGQAKAQKNALTAEDVFQYAKKKFENGYVYIEIEIWEDMGMCVNEKAFHSISEAIHHIKESIK